MPQFHLNTPARRVHPFYALDDFSKGYVEAMFFTNGDTGDDREHLLNDWGVERLTHASVAAIARDCAAFKESAGFALDFALGPMSGYSEEQAGRDFWFTRQGHGVGFWDREELRRDMARRPDGTLTDEGESEGLPFLASLGDLLTAAAKACGEAYVQAYRGWIYHS
jgi:hypothetical protein